MSESHKELRRLFELTLDAAPTDREAILDEHCGDETKAQVLAMLDADQDSKFLGSPTRERGASSDPNATLDVGVAAESVGQQIDRYKLLEQIGEGGFGTIWMAEQREPVKRRVALKIIKLGMDTKQVIARFEAERQALAMMDHPNIARVLDAGSTATGRPYFVMEYIKGIPILDYCDTEKLDTQSRLDLFATVCHAIQHAHQKGIIHRDIKPSNVLVTLHDGKPVPKVIDFGIAKATNAELTSKTLFTEHRQMIGTPAYMSPEQAEMSGLDIDTRADIYSLGVLLYELLTGTTPFDVQSLMQSGYAEMMRVIREDEPHKPSTRLSSLGDTGTRTAQQRHTDPKKLSQLIQGDLDWIVMKCLEKDRARRYDTANGLAADILRHLSDEPVVAGPPSAGYRLRKFAKRNRAKVATAAMVAVLLVLGVVGTSTALVRALAAEQDAMKQMGVAQQERNDKDRALTELEVALAKNKEVLHRTRVLALTVASTAAEETDPMRALLLAREAGRNSLLPAAVSQLHSAIVGSLERTVFRGHEAPVTSARYSPVGSRILTSSQDGTVRLWDLDGSEVLVLRGHEGPVMSAVFSPSGERILTCSWDRTARLWDLAGNELAVIRDPEFRFQSALFSPKGDRILTSTGHSGKFDPSNTLAGFSTVARLWDLQGNELAELGGHEGFVQCAGFSPAGDLILTAAGNTAHLWSLEGEELTVIHGHDAKICAAAFSPSGDQILTGSDDKTARIWDLQGQELAVLRGHDQTVGTAVFSPAGDRILTSSGDTTARLWDLEGKELVTFRGHESYLAFARFSPTGDRVLTGGLDSTARLWDLKGKEIAEICGVGIAASADFSPAGDQIVITNHENTVRTWAVEGKELAVFGGSHEKPVAHAEYSPAGDRIVTSSFDHTARIWDLGGNELVVFRGHESYVSTAAFNPSGDRIVTAGDRTARIWDLEGKELAVLRGHKATVRQASFSPAGDRIVTACHDNTARVWDLEGKELLVIEHEGGYAPMAGGPGATSVNSAVFSPGGDRILTASMDKVARLWDLAGNLLVVFRGHEANVMSATFSPTGDRVVTASHDRTARVWDLAGNELAVCRGHAHIIMTAVFAPSGDQILTGSMDTTARLWDLEGNELAVLRENGFVTHAAFSPSGDEIITATDNVKTWLAHGKDLLELADERVSREFTEQERNYYADLLGTDTGTDR